MANEQMATIFTEYRPYLRILEAFNAENFDSQDHRRTIASVRYAVCVAALFMSSASLAMLSYWHCMENGLAVDILSDAMPIILSLVQLQLTQISLMGKNREIRATIEGLQNTVDQRKFVPIFGFFQWLMNERSKKTGNRNDGRVFVDKCVC